MSGYGSGNFSRGGGRGMGMGRGGGSGRGRRFSQNSYDDQSVEPQYRPQYNNQSEVKPDVDVLKQQAKVLQQQLEDIVKKIEELETQPGGAASPGVSRTGTLKATIDEALCIGCAICVNVCPTGAITMDDGIARVDTAKCTGCGDCVSRCPRQAIRLLPLN